MPVLSRYRFRPAWPVTLAFIVLLPVLIGLGFWQLDRAAQKTDIRDRDLARGEMPPVDVNRQELEPDMMEFRRAVARGRYREEWTIFLDNQVHNGTAGYDVLTPLDIDEAEEETARFVLVNRGWIPWGESRQSLPVVDTPDGAVGLEGRLTRPPEQYFTLEDPSAAAGFAPRWQNLDLARYRTVTGLSVAPLVLELTPGTGQDDDLVRRPLRYDDAWIERHRAYAVQWFALALILVVLYLILNLKKREPDD